jgi:peptide/nickel transport system permease protein
MTEPAMIAAGEQATVAMKRRPSVGRVGAVMRLIRFSRTGTIGAVLVALFLLLAILAPLIAPADPNFQDLPSRAKFVSPQHLLGTDLLGRDMLSRILYGARVSLTLGIAAVVVGIVLGLPFGLLAGYLGGYVDLIVMRVVDILLAFPLYLLAIVVIAILGPSLPNMILAVGISSAPRFARLARGDVLTAKHFEFVFAARALGAPGVRIVLGHILPNIAGPLIVLATLRIGTAILVEASLSFVGLGPQPPTPAWGLMISDGLKTMRSAPWVAGFPGLAIMLVVLGFNLLGDGLRDALDPRLRNLRH